MTRFLPLLIVMVVGVLFLTGGALLYRAKKPAVLIVPKDQTAAGADATATSHVRGRPDAPVTLEEFADLQCPPCGMLSGPINDLEKDYRGRLRVIFRHFPLANHSHAREAAFALEAAGLQGRFWEMHGVLYREQPTWSHVPEAQPLFEAYAGTLGLDLARFKKDVSSELVKTRVEADEKRGAKLGVSNTPTIFVNDVAVPPDALRPDRLRAIVDAAVKLNHAP